jgi:hypothetical protein
MKSFQAKTTIAADPADIWTVLTDGPGYTQWASGVRSVEGQIAPGQRIKVVSEANPGRTFPVRVTEFEPGRRMTWTGGMPLGLFKGVRTFTLDPDGERTAFTLREEYSGPLLPLIWRSIPDLGPSFQQFADGLKERAERTN